MKLVITSIIYCLIHNTISISVGSIVSVLVKIILLFVFNLINVTNVVFYSQMCDHIQI